VKVARFSKEQAPEVCSRGSERPASISGPPTCTRRY
jgi:hypothetical protein